MSAQRFSVGQQFLWAGACYEVRRLLADSQLEIVSLRTNEPQTVPFLQLYTSLLTNALQFVVDDGQPIQKMHHSDYIDLADCPEFLRAVAEYRLEIIRPFLDVPSHQRKAAIAARVKELQQQHHPRTLKTMVSVVSVYRWIGDYTQSGNDIRSLIPNTHQRGGVQKSRLKAEAETLLKATINDLHCRSEKRTIDYIHREMAVRLAEENHHRLPQEKLAMPSRATVARRITTLSTKGQGSKRGSRKPRQYEATEYPTIPLARVEIDHTPSDLIVIDEADLLPLGRLTLTYCLDAVTRYPVGYYQSFEPPSYLSVMECLYHAICPKVDVQNHYDTAHPWLAHGLPFTLVVDNGKEFIGRDLDDACQALGIVLERMPVKTPQFKAAVERMFGTTNTGVFHTLPGTTFSNFGQRGDYNSLKQACINLHDLDKIMHIFLLDIYAQDFHEGLQGIPAEHWQEATQNGFFPRVPLSLEELRILLGRVDYRTILPYGIDFLSLRYNCSELLSLRLRMERRQNKQVKFKYNPSDLSRIHVYDSDERRYIETPALAQEYTRGLSLWKHRVIRNFVLNEQGQVDIVALGRAQRKIQAIVEQSMAHKKLSTRTKIGRWKNGHPSAESPAPEKVSITAGEATTNLSGLEIDLDPEELAKEGWGLSYDAPETISPGGSHDQ
jgi:putative transposase